MKILRLRFFPLLPILAALTLPFCASPGRAAEAAKPIRVLVWDERQP
jgi:hypothetical protein